MRMRDTTSGDRWYTKALPVLTMPNGLTTLPSSAATQRHRSRAATAQTAARDRRAQIRRGVGVTALFERRDGLVQRPHVLGWFDWIRRNDRGDRGERIGDGRFERRERGEYARARV